MGSRVAKKCLPFPFHTSYYLNRMQRIITWFEQQAFGVCTWMGTKLGIRTSRIRLYFIYLSFFTAGSPVILYFVMAFLLEHKHYFLPFRSRRSSVWDR